METETNVLPSQSQVDIYENYLALVRLIFLPLKEFERELIRWQEEEGKREARWAKR